MVFQPGNPGRPKGSRNRRTLLAEHLKRGEERQLARAIIEDALAGDANARKLIADRLWPARAAPPTPIALPPIADVSDLTLASSSLIAAVSKGEITASEAASVAALLASHGKLVETAVLAERMTELEARLDREDV
jgi:hypothetical protein